MKMMTFRLMIAALAMASTAAFAPVTSKNSATFCLQAGLVSEVVQVATVAGAAATIFFADKSGPVRPATPVPAPAAAAVAPASVDLSIPYDAAAMLAYEASPKDMDFESFKAKYVKETVAMVKSKQKTLVSV
jgi:hypothetical protein